MTAPPSGESLSEAYAHCESLARAHDRDRWLSALFAPTAARPHLHALSAFNYEVGRLREIVREPLAGELTADLVARRADARRRLGPSRRRGLLDTIVKFNPPMALFENHIAARQFDLYDDPMPTSTRSRGLLRRDRSSLFQFAALILAEGRDIGAADASGHAGVAYAITGAAACAAADECAWTGLSAARSCLRAMASRATMSSAAATSRGLHAALAELRALARGRLDQALNLARECPREIAPSFLPLACLPLYLARMARAGYSPFETVAEAAQWRRQWALWRAARAM